MEERMTKTSGMFENVVVHYSAIEGVDKNTYPNDLEKLSIGASFSPHFNLMRLGIHHQRVPPGRRISWPHAEADEEEFVYVLEGEPDLWLDGHVRRLKVGDGVGFPAGTGVAHTFINNTQSDVRLLVVGEANRERSRIDYPLHPKRNAEIGKRHWTSAPRRAIGPHDGKPNKD
jgi:uncharacterized cupin superfamily protein